jgi:hypothetical protein
MIWRGQVKAIRAAIWGPSRHLPELTRTAGNPSLRCTVNVVFANFFSRDSQQKANLNTFLS